MMLCGLPPRKTLPVRMGRWREIRANGTTIS
jgi:hypothetical protein